MGALDDVQAKIEQGNQALMAKAHEVSPTDFNYWRLCCPI